jgi:inosine-uridine nucleoside N-ribohydrolase
MAERLVLIDADAGTDDAWGIFLAFAAQRDLVSPRLRIVGITTVGGNTSVNYVSNNVTRVADTVNDTTVRRNPKDFYLNYLTFNL